MIVTGIDSQNVLDQAFEAARTFGSLGAVEREALLARTSGAAAGGAFELFKTTSIFDATAANPAWLGEEPPARAGRGGRKIAAAAPKPGRNLANRPAAFPRPNTMRVGSRRAAG